MKLPSAGTRLLNGNMGGMDSTGFYWAPEASETAKYINFNVSATAIKNDKRAYGMPIRCIWATDEEIDGITFGVSIGGKITYDFVPGSEKGLDYAHTQKRPVRGVVVELLDRNGITVAETNTDSRGRYNFENIPADTDVKIRIKAQMYKTGTPGWDVRVVDNTNRRSLNIVETTLFNTGASQKIKYIYFPSGWGKYSYITPRVAAPFAILDTTYKCMQLVLSADPSTVFPLLKVNWSELNNISIGHYDRGDIGSSQYKDGQLYILGKADKDTDEYDAPVIAYEWGMLLSRQVLLF
ncbi:MAG: carboxypeptidase regulatory-like domain-containing protein [Sulfurovum sp.]|nr:carboxypeptidase regulatory-like domain-containing protein [Sulfurovum sp.]